MPSPAARPYPPAIFADYVRQMAREYTIRERFYVPDDYKDKQRRTAVGIACRDILKNDFERHCFYGWLINANEPIRLNDIPDNVIFGLAKAIDSHKDDLLGWTRSPHIAAELLAAAQAAVQVYEGDVLTAAADMGGVVSETPADPLDGIDW